jgi:hypothetical protein
MENHAKHENEVIHPLLSAKGSKLIDEFEIDHKNYVAIFEDLKSRMQDLISITDESELIRKSYEFYIAYRQFLAMDLLHINKEELIIMPALQEYYSDEELKKNIDFPIYAQMSSEDMIEMMHILFPYMNVDDKEHFLHDIKEAQPEKFTKAWQGISPSINRIERDQLVKKLKLDMIIKVETTH